MTARFARHSQDIKRLKRFYTEILGLDVLGEFKDHDGYDGVFLGWQETDWHLEFTSSSDLPQQQFDDDDAFVLYPSTQSEYDDILLRVTQNNIEQLIAKNPYWQDNGITISDPEGYRIIISDSRIQG